LREADAVPHSKAVSVLYPKKQEKWRASTSKAGKFLG
jgi:hypothetical protein